MYHNPGKNQAVSQSFRKAPSSLKEQQKNSSTTQQYPLNNKSSSNFGKKQQIPSQDTQSGFYSQRHHKHAQISTSLQKASGAVSALSSTQSSHNLTEYFEPKYSPAKVTSSRHLRSACYTQDDSDTPTMKVQSQRELLGTHGDVNRIDSETSSGTSESLGGYSSNSITSANTKSKASPQSQQQLRQLQQRHHQQQQVVQKQGLERQQYSSQSQLLQSSERNSPILTRQGEQKQQEKQSSKTLMDTLNIDLKGSKEQPQMGRKETDSPGQDSQFGVQNKIKVNQREIPMGQRETAPFQFTFEWNTFYSDSLLLNSMKQMKEEEQYSSGSCGSQTAVKEESELQEETEINNTISSLPTKRKVAADQSLSASKNTQFKHSPAASSIGESVGGINAFRVKESDQNIQEIKAHGRIPLTTITLKVKKNKKISKKKDPKENQFEEGKSSSRFNNLHTLKQKLNRRDKRQAALRLRESFDLEDSSAMTEAKESSSSCMNHNRKFNKRHSDNKQERRRRKYYYQDPEIENYVGSEYQATIPDIIPGYRPKLYTLKYDHSKVSVEDFDNVKANLQEQFGNHVTEEDAANIIVETDYDINKINEHIENKKFDYQTYFTQQKRLQNQRKGQIKRIGTLKRRRKNVLTL